jgi:hypothetical protein
MNLDIVNLGSSLSIVSDDISINHVNILHYLLYQIQLMMNLQQLLLM